MSMAQRRFNSEISTLIDTMVTVVTTDNKTYTGTLIGLNPENLNLIISDAKDSESHFFSKVVISGNTVARVLSTQKAFDLRGLAERLERVFPRMVKLYEKEGFIWVMDRVKVTEKFFIAFLFIFWLSIDYLVSFSHKSKQILIICQLLNLCQEFNFQTSKYYFSKILVCLIGEIVISREKEIEVVYAI